jgi:cytochrome b561
MFAGLYLTTGLMLVTGVFSVNHAVPIFGPIHLSPLGDESMRITMAAMHFWLARLLAALVLLHAAVALLHWRRGQPVFDRMGLGG